VTSQQCIGYSLNQTSAITAITSTRIFHGNRVEGTVYPSINYFSIGNSFKNGLNSEVYSINCRAENIDTSKALGKLVVKLFCGNTFDGTYGLMNSFNILEATLNAPVRTLAEPGDSVFNTPVDIRIVYVSTEET
jgi:hypothetical protein